MPALEQLILHRLQELDGQVRAAYAAFDYKKVHALLTAFMTSELSAFYFDVRKDALYCDPISSVTRRACLTVLDEVFTASSPGSRPSSASPARRPILPAPADRKARCIC